MLTWHRRTLLAFVLTVLALTLAGGAQAGPNLSTERTVTEAITKALATGATTPTYVPHHLAGTNTAVLPQLGYMPSEGAVLGIKYVDRDLTARHFSLDFGAVYATKGQQELDVSLLSPELFHPRLLGLVQFSAKRDPTKEFFGLGNNNVGPDPLSTEGYRRLTALFTVGWRFTPKLMVLATAGYNKVDISRGTLRDGFPSTVDAFPDLAGIDGGVTSPVSLSLVYDTRTDLTRPTRGWHVIAKVQHVGPPLAPHFRYTRYVVDASYLYPLFTRRQIIGLRIAAQYIDGDIREIPFFELASLGGADTLRGFYDERFLGKSDLVINAEYRLKLADFQFRNLWRVRIDGVLFGDMGRVFLGAKDRQEQFRLNDDLIPRVFREFRYSYGFGTRIALSEALLARVDVGYSNEYKGLVYLTFGHMF